MKEKKITAFSGLVMLLFVAGLFIASVGLIITAARHGEGSAPLIVAGIGGIVLFFFLLPGFMSVQPNTGNVMTLFGKYMGTVKEPGLQWANPLYTQNWISLRVRNFETTHLKVNDKDGNPIEIAAVVVWKVVDTAEASFMVDNYENYVKVQSEGALRNMAPPIPTMRMMTKKLRYGPMLLKSPRIFAMNCMSGCKWLGWRRLRHGSAIWLTLRKLQRRCCKGSRLRRLLRRGRGLWKVRLVWWKWRWNGCRKTMLLRWMKTARRLWFPTCLWFFVENGQRSRWLIPGRFISKGSS